MPSDPSRPDAAAIPATAATDAIPPPADSIPRAVVIPGTQLRLTIELRPNQRNAAPEIEGDSVIVTGERSWLIRGSPDDVDHAAAALAGLCTRLDHGLLQVDFGNAVGRFRLGDGAIEVVSGKWTAAHFDRMLDDLTAIAAGLPFSAGRGGALPYHRTQVAQHDVMYHAFVYLRHITLGDQTPAGSAINTGEIPAGTRRAPLPAALAVILADPHRRWVRDAQSVPIEQARQVDARALFDAVLGQTPLLRLPEGMLATMPVARALHNHLPMRVAETRIHPAVDTPENRFVKAFLGLAEQVIGDMREAVQRRAASLPTGASAFEQRILGDCEAMLRVLTPAIRHPLWREVGRMVHVPLASTVLQRRRGYRDVLTHFTRLRLATRLPLDSRDARDLLEVKDIALMYELWCYFTVVDRISAHLGQPVAASMCEGNDFEIRVAEEKAAVAWRDGTRLLYNPRFSRSPAASRQSYSVPLRPDIALVVPSGPNKGLHLLDAKFRLDRIAEIMPVGESSTDESSPSEDGVDSSDEANEKRERSGDYKRADLYKMHTYRDAIRDARSVWILYPGTESRYFAENGDAPTDSLDLQGCSLNGVGAIPLRPEATGAEALDLWVSTVLGVTRNVARPQH
jgi:predicted component of viral defense system (DUF524 family)